MNSRHDPLLKTIAQCSGLAIVLGLFCTIMGCVTGPTSTTVTCTTNAVGVVTCVTNTTPGTSVLDTNTLLQGIQFGAQVATQQTTAADTNSAQYFVLATNVIADAILNGNVNPTNITSQIMALAGATPNQQVVLGIDNIIQGYQIFFSQQVAQGVDANSPLFVQCLNAVIAGIAEGLPVAPVIVNTPAAPTKPSP